MKIYLVRHGETDVNRILNHGVTGPMHNEPVAFKEGDDTNVPLNIYGRKHAQDAVSHLPDHIDVMYRSPLLRVEETAEIIAKEKRFNSEEIIIRPELKEYHAGSLEGLSEPKKAEVAGGKVWGSGLHSNYDYTKWGGDSWKTIYDRLDSLLKEIKETHADDEVIVCVTSGGVIRMAYKLLLSDRAPEISKHIHIPNGSVHQFVI